MTEKLAEYWKDDFKPLQAAANQINAALRADEDAADLYRRIGSGNRPSSHLYFASSHSSSSGIDQQQPPPPLQRLEHHKSVPLPGLLQEKVRNVKYQHSMGLFAQAELAWIAVDDELHLWSYNASTPGFLSPESNDPSTFCSLKVPSGQNVMVVELVRPRKSK